MASFFRASLLIFLLANYKAKADCEGDLEEYFQGLNPATPKLWSLKMLDSSSKMPVGAILEASFLVQLGNYDECLAVRGPKDTEGNPRFKGQYCQYFLGFEGKQMGILNDTISNALAYQQNMELAINGGVERLAKPVGLPFQWSVCAPSSCGPEQIKKIADFNFNFFSTLLTLNANTTVIPQSCYFEGDGSKTLDAASWVFLSFTAILMSWIIFSSIFDHWNPNMQNSGWFIFVKAFSLKTTMKDLIKLPKTVAPGQLSCLHGIRVFSTLWVLLGHSYMFYQSWPLTNYLSASLRFNNQWLMGILYNGFLAVDTFFLLSGLLTAYVPLMDVRKGRKFSVPKYYIYRYLRITAPLAYLIFYLSTVHGRISHGPVWFITAGMSESVCRENWWVSLLYATNYFLINCVGQAWYLCVDMQLALLAPLILIPLIKWPKYGLGAILLLTLGSMAACFGITYVESYPWTLGGRIDTKTNGKYTTDFYPNTPLRAVPYLVGMALGYILSNKTKVLMPKSGAIIGWILSAAISLSVVFTILITYSPDFEYDKLGAAFYAAFHKLGWSLGVSWVIWACVNGFGGIVDKLLSWKYFVPLSKLSFCAYLVHQDFMQVHRALRRTANTLTHFEALYDYFGQLVFILPLSVILYLAVEAPVMMLLKFAFKKSALKDIADIGEKKH